jgi:hypothetical protein
MEEQPNLHFFASSIGEWRTTNPERDLRDLFRAMDRGGLAYNLFVVPLPWDSAYDISDFAPQAPGALWLGYFEPKKKGAA